MADKHLNIAKAVGLTLLSVNKNNELQWELVGPFPIPNTKNNLSYYKLANGTSGLLTLDKIRDACHQNMWLRFGPCIENRQYKPYQIFLLPSLSYFRKVGLFRGIKMIMNSWNGNTIWRDNPAFLYKTMYISLYATIMPLILTILGIGLYLYLNR